MTKRNGQKLNRLQRDVPEGLLVDAAWMTAHGYSTSLRTQYVAAGWLEQPVRGVFRRPRGELTWEKVVISLQMLLDYPVVVGGRTALELQGYAHYLAHERREVHLYSPKPLPGWLYKLPVGVRFVCHNSERLFKSDSVPRGLAEMTSSFGAGASSNTVHDEFGVMKWGQWDWPLTLSTPERAILELLDELPRRESFHQVDKFMEGLASLSPRRLQKLLADCRSVKVKRLFFFFADRHRHRWLPRIDRDSIDLGKGKRMLVKGGKLDPAYQITVPGDLDAA